MSEQSPQGTEQQPALSTEKGAEATAQAAAGEKPAATATAVKEAPAAKPTEEKAEPPFTTDVLQSCTSRFTRKAWDIYLTYQKDISLIRTKPVRGTLTARSVDGAEELHKLLSEAGVTEISRQDKTLSFTATFEQIQAVIKHPQSYAFDAVKI